MGAKHGRVEAMIEVPTGGWDVDIEGATDGGTPVTATIPAGVYYMTTLIAECKTQFDDASQDTWTISWADGEDGTGKVSILSPAWVGLTWVDTDLQDALGFENDGATLSGTGTATSSDQAKFCWFPDAPFVTLLGPNDDGWRESDLRMTESPGGQAKGLYGNNKTVNSITWSGISRAKCRVAGEATLNESFEQFWLDAVIGTGGGGYPGAQWNFYWDADVATATAYTPHGIENWQPEQLSPGMVEYWRIIVPRLVKVPA